MSQKIQIITLRNDSPYLDLVIKLGDQHRHIFGHWAQRIYSEYAKCGTILIALTHNKLAGYIMYRNAPRKNQVVLHQLCVSPEYRGRGLAKLLIEELKSITTQYNGIRIKCRRDYNLEEMWSKLGFCPLYEQPARTKGMINTIWWYSHTRPLFSWLAENQQSASIKLILDLDLFLLLGSDSRSNDYDQIASICHNEWDVDAEIYRTDEILSIINNFENDQEREEYRKLAYSLKECAPLGNELGRNIAKFKNFFESHAFNLSDLKLRHIARAALSPEIQYFITRDLNILSLKDALYERFFLFVKEPNEFIVELSNDTIQDNYQPKSLSGVQRLSQVLVEKSVQYANLFFKKNKSFYDEKIVNYMSQCIGDSIDWIEIQDKKNNTLILFFYDWTNQFSLRIPFFHLAQSSYSNIISNHLLFKTLDKARKNNRVQIEISKKYLPESITSFLRDDSAWIQTNSSWFRILIDEIGKSDDLIQIIKGKQEIFEVIPSQYSQLIDVLENVNDLTIQNALEIENLFFPIKITDSLLPTFIVPIKPEWAKNLFDENLANESLFGCGDLALNTEAVYYKTKLSPKKMKPGYVGRILWYVSNDNDNGYSNLSSIRACSHLIEVRVDKPENLYQSFKTLGVYNYEDVLKVAENNPDREIMALKFKNTELFDTPVSLHRLQKILTKNVTMQGSLEISGNNFMKIYQEGMGYCSPTQ